MKDVIPTVHWILSRSFSMRFRTLFVLLTGFRPNISLNGFRNKVICPVVCSTSHTSYILFVFIVVWFRNVGIYFLLLMFIFWLAISVFSRLRCTVTSPEHTETLSKTLPNVFFKFSASSTKILRLGQPKRTCGLTYLPTYFPAECFLFLFLNLCDDTEHKNQSQMYVKYCRWVMW